MDVLLEFFHKLHNVQDLVAWGGFVVLAIIIFAETGLLIGFFLPGDSLLFGAGALIATGHLKAPSPLPQDPLSSIIALNAVLIIAAIVGDTVGYWFGRKTGPRLFNRPNSRLFKREHLDKTQAFYDQHGGKTIIMARWVPFARTFAPIVAGVAQMPYSTFMTFNVIGGISWVMSCSLLGYFLGSIAWVRDNNEKVILLIVGFSVLPVVIHWLKSRLDARKKAKQSEALGTHGA